MTPPTRYVIHMGKNDAHRVSEGTIPVQRNQRVGGAMTPPYESVLDNFSHFLYNVVNAKQIRLRGAGRIRLRVSLLALTREPDTANTVGGKDRNTNCGIALHPETGLRRDL